MKFKKVLALALAGTMCLAAFAGCSKKNESTSGEGNKADEKITATIKVWSPAEDQAASNGEWLQTRCEAFKAEHPNWDLTFVYEVCGEDKAAETITTDPASAADVFMFANDQINKLIDADALAKLGGTTADYVKSTNSEAIVNSVTVDGAIYGVPYTTNTWFMYYDKSVFSEDDIKSLDTMLSKAKVSFPLTNSWYIASFYAANGCTLFEDGTNEEAGIDFSGDKAVAVTDYLVDLVANPNFMNEENGCGIAGLKDGSVGAMFSGSWDASNVRAALGENFGAVELPSISINGENKQLYSFAGSKALGVNRNTEHPEIAVALALWLGNAESQQSRYEARGVVPCNTELLQSDAVKSDALVIAQNNTFDKTSIMQPFVKAMDNYWSAAENMGKALVAGTVTHENSASETEAMNTAMNTSAVQ